MAVLNINILNPRIDLISNLNEVTNSCKTVFTFDILSTPGASIEVTVINKNNKIEDYDSIQYTNGGRFIDAISPTQTFVMNARGKASFKVEIGNAPGAVSSNGSILLNKCNVVQVTVVDTTNNKSESTPMVRCVPEERCEPYVPPTTPPAPTIDAQTNIRIYFDNSGSMNGTLDPLNFMQANQLKTALSSYYSSAEYDSKVKVWLMGSKSGVATYEDPFTSLNYGGENLSGKVISLVFMDEANAFTDMIDGFDITKPSTEIHDTNLATFRNRLSGFPPNYYNGVLFQVATPNVATYMIDFSKYITAVKNGTGVYVGSNGLSDKSQVNIKLAITPGENFTTVEEAATYYKDLIVTSLNELGFNL